jgi:ATP-dependent DNA helicase RecG
MIPLSIEVLLKGQVVESDRIEYKRGWNPSSIIPTICAFANDINNTNGGYIVIGIDTENGRPVLPPAGIEKDLIDTIELELFQYCHLIQPTYAPIMEIVEFEGKTMVYLWCRSGRSGPYKAPKDLFTKDKKHKDFWIRPFSVTTIANDNDLFMLFDKFNYIEADERVNERAIISDIRLGHIDDFLHESESSLVETSIEWTIEDFLLALDVADKTYAGIDIKNIALLMFSDYPEKLLPSAFIEFTWFHSPDRYTEKLFKGPIHRQVRDAISYIFNSSIIEEQVIKLDDRPEAERFFTYPKAAIEEVIVNAVMHKSYLINSPVEIRVYDDRIIFINYPGPPKIVDMQKLKEGRAIVRSYRNGRIGEFFKEIKLAEKKASGMPKILNSLFANGSPPPEFETNADRDYFMVTLFKHKSFLSKTEGKKQDGKDIFQNMISYPKTWLKSLLLSVK